MPYLKPAILSLGLLAGVVATTPASAHWFLAHGNRYWVPDRHYGWRYWHPAHRYWHEAHRHYDYR